MMLPLPPWMKTPLRLLPEIVLRCPASTPPTVSFDAKPSAAFARGGPVRLGEADSVVREAVDVQTFNKIPADSEVQPIRISGEAAVQFYEGATGVTGLRFCVYLNGISDLWKKERRGDLM